MSHSNIPDPIRQPVLYSTTFAAVTLALLQALGLAISAAAVTAIMAFVPVAATGVIGLVRYIKRSRSAGSPRG